ncbi:tetratricopeptide repeat protein [Bifidobacterium crudilactis]|jgi:tetratricopeptide (TPR) repeat protein|uniref:tetratricopeptide repeat protein n=1 Tax=Bifidobacterium crudilactis TaxID=327277 RepID=UPI002353AAA0|nr:tetratricopeptide repeat protein [Bifidobacterium crudilactis]MCI2147974.1 hypothetical protein [Bifidobacterium crudilactis]MCI2158404.1 hypothetical protein [Bifidobacterium crudilactis]
MVSTASGMVCPGCGASVSLEDKNCQYCGRKLTFTATDFKAVRKATFTDSRKFLEAYKSALKESPSNPDILASLGFTLLDSEQFSEAADKLEAAISNGADNPDVVFHAALARFRAKKPFQIKLKEATSIIQTVDVAIGMIPSPQYLYAKARLVRVLFEQRYLKYVESSADILAQAEAEGLTPSDQKDIDSLLTSH